jgi:hypothetical protein
MDAELIEGNYVLYQGDLSITVLEKLRSRRLGEPLPAVWPGPGK